MPESQWNLYLKLNLNLNLNLKNYTKKKNQIKTTKYTRITTTNSKLEDSFQVMPTCHSRKGQKDLADIV